jgi:hypothetical protein
MPKVNFSQVDDLPDFEPLPDGRYLCRINDIKVASTQSGDEMWKLSLEVLRGEWAGRRIFDNLVFSEKALSRVKLVCSSLGVDVSGEVILEPSTIMGKRCWVEVRTEEYVDAEGILRMRNSVPYGGYQEASEDDEQMSQVEPGESFF